MNKSDLRKIIKEEIQRVLNEESRDTLRDLRAGNLYENEETTTVKMGSKNIVMKPGTEITPEMEQLIRRYDHHYRYIDDYTQMKDAEKKNKEIMAELLPLGIIRIW